MLNKYAGDTKSFNEIKKLIKLKLLSCGCGCGETLFSNILD